MATVQIARLLFAAVVASAAAADLEVAVRLEHQRECHEAPALVMLQGMAKARQRRTTTVQQAPSADDLELFPSGQVPFEVPGRYASENVYGPPDPKNPIGLRCAPGELSTEWAYNVTVPLMKPFLVSPDTPGRTDVSVLVLPGGGFDVLAWEKEGTDVAKWLNSLGISAFVLRYRVPVREIAGQGPTAAAGMDGQRAMKVLRSLVHRFGLNPQRIGVIGFSAGGSLALMTTHTKKTGYPRIDDADDLSHRPAFQLLIYPGYPQGFHAGSLTDTPPTFIAVAEDDQCTPPLQIMPYFAALEAVSRAPSELHVYSNGRHGYGTCRLWVEHSDSFQEACEWTLNARLFLEAKVLGTATKELNAKLPGIDVGGLSGAAGA